MTCSPDFRAEIAVTQAGGLAGKLNIQRREDGRRNEATFRRSPYDTDFILCPCGPLEAHDPIYRFKGRRSYEYAAMALSQCYASHLICQLASCLRAQRPKPTITGIAIYA